MANTSLNRTLCGSPSLGSKSLAQTRPTAKCRLARTLGLPRMPQRTYHRTQHRFFDSLVAFTAGVSSLGIALDAQKNGTAQGYSPNQYLALTGNPAVSGIEFHFYPHSLLSTLLNNDWPDLLVLDEYPINQSPVIHPLNLTGLQGVHGAMVANAFVKFFEETRSLVETKHSTDAQKWPTVWNLGRVMRNALGHKGVIQFKNQHAQPVTWRKLCYSPSDNGKAVLYHDVTAVELILLMEDMDAVI